MWYEAAKPGFCSKFSVTILLMKLFFACNRFVFLHSFRGRLIILLLYLVCISRLCEVGSLSAAIFWSLVATALLHDCSLFLQSINYSINADFSMVSEKC
jgi:hypothetical protein